MSDNTKQILAITLGTLGLVIGVVATIVAFNARDAANSNEEVTRLVDQRFSQAQARQDALEKKQASDAERLVANLDRGERNLIGKINSNSRSISRIRLKNNNLRSQIRSLSRSYGNLSTRVSSLSTRVTNLQDQAQGDFNTLNTRIDRTNRRFSNQGGGANP